MADLATLETALRNADAAGDVEAARILAAEVVKMRSAPETGGPAYSGSILPLSRDASGKVSFDSNAGIVGSLKRAFTLPGEVMGGTAKLPSSEGLPGSVPFGDPASAGDRVAELAMTAAPVNPAIRAGERIIPGAALAPRNVQQKPVVPTGQELYDSGVKNLNAARDSGLEIAPDALASFSQRVQQSLYKLGISPVDAEKTFTKLKAIEDAPAGAVVTAANLKSLRDSFGHTAQNFNPQSAKDQLAASRAIGELDDFVKGLGQKDTLAGDPAATAKLWDRGRGDYAAAMRSNDITGELDRAYTGVLEQAELGAQAAHSGRNFDNTVRQKVAASIKKEKDVSGLSDEEIAALRRVVDGGPARNVARKVGNWLGAGGGLGQTFLAGGGAAGGGAIGGIPGAVVGAMVPAAVGGSARSLANTLAKRSVNQADEMIRKRSPLFEERVANPEMSMRDPEVRAALLRALMASAPSSAGQERDARELARILMRQ